MSDGTSAAPVTSAPATTETATPATPATPPAPARLKIKDLDLSEDDAFAEIQRGRQTGKLLTEVQKRAEKAAASERFFEQKKAEARKNPKAILESLGLSKEEASELFSRYLYENEILPQQMSPEAKKIREYEEKLKGFEDEKQTKAQEEKKVAYQKEVDQHKTRLAQEIGQVLNDKKIPGTRFAVRRVADYLASYAQAGVEVPTQVAVDQVLNDYRHEFSGIIDSATPEQLIAFFGMDKFKALAKKISIWAVGASAPKALPEGGHGQVNVSTEKRARISPQDFDKLLSKGGI